MNKRMYRYKSFWLALLVIGYLLLGFFYVPQVIQNQMQKQLSAQLNMQAQLNEVSFNPLTFETQIGELSFTDQQQQTWFKSNLASVNLDPTYLLTGTWKFAEIRLEQPQVTIKTDDSGQLVVPSLPEFPVGSDQPSEVTLMIDRIILSQGEMHINANHIKQDFDLGLKSIEFKHNQFSLADEDTAFDVRITTTEDATLTLQGHYNHVGQYLQTSLDMNNWPVTYLNRILPDALGLTTADGWLSARGEMNWNLNRLPTLQLEQISINAVQAAWQQNLSVSALDTVLLGSKIDVNAQTVAINQWQSQQAQWQVNWPWPAQQTDIENAPEVSAATASQESTPWLITIDEVNLNDWPVVFNDQNLNETLNVSIDAWQINDLNNNNAPMTGNTALVIDQSNINSQWQLASLNPLQVDAELLLEGLQTPNFSPWISAQSGLVVSAGKLNAKQRMKLDGEAFQLTGDVALLDTQLENTTGQPIADWRELRIASTDINNLERTITIDAITLDQANGNLILDADKNLNIQNLRPAGQSAQEPRDVSPEDSSDATGSDWVIKIGQVDFKQTSTSLIDQSVQPAVTTRISELNGQISGLSSETLTQAEVSINGQFNQFSPLSIQGQINPLSSAAYTDLTIEVKDLDLLAFSPYAAQYVAFPIQGGKLDLSLSYLLNQSELRGDNQLLFKQFKLGNKTPSPEAVDLPLKLAVSLLTDLNGEMKIDLPVAGNLNDPEFSYGGLVGRAIFKLITNIVASPFKILGALIPNPDPNMSDIQFTSGSAELLPSEQVKLQQIAAIMAQKPSLNLVLKPHVNQSFDQPGLQQQQLLSQAPFAALDLNQEPVRQWLQTQLTPESLQTYQTAEGGYDHALIWDMLVKRQVLAENAFRDLNQKRTDQIKSFLATKANIAAEQVFVEQSSPHEAQQSLVKVGVSQ